MSASIHVVDLNVWFDDNHALKNVNMEINGNEITAIIGPSGCGKSTFIRSLNRMNDIIMSCEVKGQVVIDGMDIYGKGVDVVHVRKKVGMVFQKPNPFPKSVHEKCGFCSEDSRHREERRPRCRCGMESEAGSSVG